MIEWILHRPPHASNKAEIRVAERLRGLVDSPHTWIVIWGYYYEDSRGVRREGDFLILGPAGGLLVLEVKSSLPRHFPETGRWEGAGGDDPISQLNTEWQGVIHGIRAKGNPPYVEKALCVPEVHAPSDVEYFQGIPRNWLVTGNDLENWVGTWLRIFGNRVRNPVNPLEKRAVLEAFGQGSLPRKSVPSSITPKNSSSASSPPASPCWTSSRKTASFSSTAAPGPARPGTRRNSPSATPAREPPAASFSSPTTKPSPPWHALPTRRTPSADNILA